MSSQTKLIVILGPTASGKSSLALKLAKKINGEIISADSRQVYRGMDIGTGKVTKKEQKLVPHHLLDVASPKKQFSVAQYKLLTILTIVKIVSRNKIPFLVGGTPFYIYSVIDDWQIPEVKPNPKLRKQLEKKATPELFKLLKKLDPRRAKTIDRHNPRRLIRAIEIVKMTGRPVPSLLPPSLFPSPQGGGKELRPNSRIRIPPPEWGRLGGGEHVLLLGVKKERNKLKKLINKRVKQRFKQGLVSEVRKLLRQGLSLKRLNKIGLTYKIIANYVCKNVRSDKNAYRDLIKKVEQAEYKFSKRQMTWFKRDKRIHWIKNRKQAERAIRSFLLDT